MAKIRNIGQTAERFACSTFWPFTALFDKFSYYPFKLSPPELRMQSDALRSNYTRAFGPKERTTNLKTIVTTFVLTVAALAVASTSHVYNYGLRTSPAQIIEMGSVPPPCGLKGLPPCPWQAHPQAKSERSAKVVAE
jgi:hypothetical protein